VLRIRIPHHVDADPDPSFYFDVDPKADMIFHFDADPDSDTAFHCDADPDPTLHFQRIRILRSSTKGQQTLRGSISGYGFSFLCKSGSSFPK
jgi:hypothetical protein